MITGSSAGFGRRAAALLYDLFLLVALLIVYTFGAIVFTRGHAILHDTVGPWYYVYCAGELAVIALYYVVNWSRSGQTLGMRAWQLRVVSEQGKPLRPGQALLRLVCSPLAWLPAALGVLWLYWDSDGLALHDRLSKTRVVRLTRS